MRQQFDNILYSAAILAEHIYFLKEANLASKITHNQLHWPDWENAAWYGSRGRSKWWELLGSENKPAIVPKATNVQATVPAAMAIFTSVNLLLLSGLPNRNATARVLSSLTKPITGSMGILCGWHANASSAVFSPLLLPLLTSIYSNKFYLRFTAQICPHLCFPSSS